MEAVAVSPTRTPRATQEDRIVRPAEAAAMLGYKNRWGLYDLVKAGRLPKPIRITARCVGWRLSTLQRFIDDCERQSRIG